MRSAQIIKPLLLALAWLLCLWPAPAGAQPAGQPMRWHSFTAANGLAGNIVQAIWQAPGGEIWFGTENGVSRYDGRGWRTYRIGDGLIDNNVWSISGDGRVVWFATNNGISSFDGALWRSFTTQQGLPGNDVRSILVDRQGSTWAGTFGQGLALLRPGASRWALYDPALGDLDNFVQVIWQAPGGAIWFGTNGSGALRLDQSGVETFSFSNENRNVVWSIGAEREGDRTWLATFNGILTIESTGVVTAEQQQIAQIALDEIEVLAVAGGQRDDLWFGTRSHGVFHRDGNGWQHYTDDSGLGRNYIQTIYVDAEERVWFGTRGGGVTMLSRQPLPAEALRLTVSASSLQGGEQLPPETTTFDYRHNDLQFHFSLPVEWLPPQEIHFDYWLERQGGDQGTVAPPADVQQGRSAAENPARASSEPFIDLEPGEYLLHVVPYVGAVAGPEQLYAFSIRSAPPELAADRVAASAGGQALERGMTMPQVLFESTRQVELRFAAGDDLTQSEQLRYFYRVDGAGEEWQQAAGARASIPLSQGAHTIEVQARDAEGNLSELVAMTVIVPEPLWLRIATYLALLLVPSTLSGVVGALSYRRWSRRQALLRAVRGAFIPYDVGPLITVADRYIGRQQVLDTILGKLDNNNFYIYGEKRIGKTSLLLQLKQRLLQRNQLGHSQIYLPVFRNIQDLPQQQFWLHLVRSIGAELDDLPGDLGAYAAQPSGYDDLDAETDLERIVEHLRARHPGREPIVVLLLDELDTLQRYDPAIRQRFRAFCQHLQRNVRVVLAGVLPPRAESGETSPWYNIFDRVTLGPLDQQGTLRLIRSYNNNPYSYTDEAELAIVAAGDGKPFDTQWLCSEAVKAMLAQSRTTINAGDATQAIRAVLDERRSEYVVLWQGLPAARQAELLSALEHDGELSPGGDAAPYDELLGAGVALRTPGGYRLTSLFQRWLKERR